MSQARSTALSAVLCVGNVSLSTPMLIYEKRVQYAPARTSAMCTGQLAEHAQDAIATTQHAASSEATQGLHRQGAARALLL